jgi:hypothetical protein
MKLGVVSFLAALVAVPLTAQAAESPARFAVTLRATIVEELQYEVSRNEEECLIVRSGSGGRELTLRSIRATRIQVGGEGGGVTYRPSRVTARLTGTANLGGYVELKRCRGAPPERITADCKSRLLPARGVRPGFRRPAPNTIAFGAGTSVRGEFRVCGFNQPFPGSWLDLAPGRVDEQALLSGRSLRVIARGSVTKTVPPADTRGVKVTRRMTVRWTLTFRRLG